MRNVIQTQTQTSPSFSEKQMEREWKEEKESRNKIAKYKMLNMAPQVQRC